MCSQYNWYAVLKETVAMVIMVTGWQWVNGEGYRIPGNIGGQKIWRFYSKSSFKKYWWNFNLAANPPVTHVRYYVYY